MTQDRHDLGKAAHVYEAACPDCGGLVDLHGLERLPARALVDSWPQPTHVEMLPGRWTARHFHHAWTTEQFVVRRVRSLHVEVLAGRRPRLGHLRIAERQQEADRAE